MATMVHTNLKRRTSTSKFLPSNRMRKKTFRFPLDLTRRVFPENFTNRKRSSTASSCFPTNRSSATAAAARTRDNTMTKEATISKKRTMTRRMKKRPQENRRCYGFAKAFLSERILNTRTGGSVAVTLLRPDSQWSCPQPTDEQFWHIHGQRPRRSAFYLLISLAFKRDLEHIRRCSRSYSILVILQTLAGRRGQCFSVALSSLLFNLIRLRIADALWTSPWHVSIFTRSLSTDAGWNRVATNFTVSNCFVLVFIYICIWMEKKEGSNDGIFFFFYSSLLPISRDFRDFSSQTDRATGSYFLSHLGREYDR